MNSDDLKSRAQALRAAGRTPQQIARTLGITRARAVSLTRGHASPRPAHSAPGDKPLIGCWITRQWSNGLIIDQRPADWIDDNQLPPLAMGAGLASIAVARQHTDTEVSVCGYLVDTYCQGVKNAVPPTMLDRRDLPAYLTNFFAAYNTDPLPAPISLAQDLVLGAVDYARSLGFDPHRDFYWPNRTSEPRSHPTESNSDCTASHTSSKAPTTTPPGSCAPSTDPSDQATTGSPPSSLPTANSHSHRLAPTSRTRAGVLAGASNSSIRPNHSR